jgi:hypothetical protein
MLAGIVLLAGYALVYTVFVNKLDQSNTTPSR